MSVFKYGAGGLKYEGEWRGFFRLHGQGTLTWVDGIKYVGEFRDDEMHGQGTFTFPDGEKWEGESRDGKLQGKFTITLVGGGKRYTEYIYAGEYRESKKSGQGAMTYLDGSEYFGEFREDKPTGNGIFIFAKGEKNQGE